MKSRKEGEKRGKHKGSSIFKDNSNRQTHVKGTSLFIVCGISASKKEPIDRIRVYQQQYTGASIQTIQSPETCQTMEEPSYDKFF